MNTTEIGTTPGGWTHAEIGMLCQVVDCKHVTAEFVPRGYPVASIGELGDRFVDLRHAPMTTERDFSLLTEGARRLRAGDLIMSRNATVGRVGRVAESHPPFAMGQDVSLLRARPGACLPRYLQLVLQAPSTHRDFEAIMAGSTFKRLNVQQIKRLELLMPSVEEQSRIVDVVEDVEDLTYALERRVTKMEAIRQGMMQQLLTGRTRLPGFESTWTEFKLGDHVNYVKTVALSRAQLDSNSPLKYLHYGDIHTRASVLLDASSEEMPRASAKLANRAGLLHRGDLVFADASEDSVGVGKSVEIVDIPEAGVVPGLHTIAARFDKSVLADGFKAYLQFIPAFRVQLLRLAAGTKVLATTRSYISSVTLTLPGVDEQKAIAKVLFDVEHEIEGLRIRLFKARAIKTGMMQQLLTGRTRLPMEAGS